MQAVCHAASPPDWPGWRGLEREGRAEPGNYPTHWSPDKNVRWKTPIPGRGHSSPIVVGDKVFLTTAYFTGRGEGLKRAAGIAVLAATGILTLLAVPLALRSPPSGTPPAIGQTASAICLCFVLGALASSSLAVLSHYAQGEMNTERRMELWLVSAASLSLCLMIAAPQPRSRRWMRLATGTMALAFAAFILLGRPDPLYFDLVTEGRYSGELFTAMAFPVAVAIALLLGALLEWKRAALGHTGGGAAEHPTTVGPTLLGKLLALLGPGICFGFRLAFGIAAFVGALLLPPGGWDPAAQWFIMGICLAIWPLGRILCLGRRPAILPKWMAVGFLGLGAISFAERNYLLTTKEFVRAIVCVDGNTGAVKWTTEALHGPQAVLSRRNSPATPTPVADAERVYAWFGSAGAMCADHDGKLLWTNADLPFECVHGAGPSLLLADGKLIVTGTQADAPYIAALDPRTGQRVWTTRLRPWPGIEGQHRAPTLASANRGLLLLWGWEGAEREDALRAFDVRSGKALRKHPLPAHNEAVASIISDGDMLFLANSHEAHALSLTKLGSGENPVLWTTPLKMQGPHVASPVLCGGMLFTVSNRGRASCLDAKTGSLLWQEQVARQVSRGGSMASPIAAGGAVYFPDVPGKITVVAAEPKFRKLAENDLGEPLWASPAPVGGRLYIRTTGHLWCIEEKP